MVFNHASRWHLLLRAVRAAALSNPAVATKSDALMARYNAKFAEHTAHGEDLPEIRNWHWVQGRHAADFRAT